MQPDISITELHFEGTLPNNSMYDMVIFLKFPKKLCSGLMYAFVIYTLQMILNGGERGHKGSNAALWP